MRPFPFRFYRLSAHRKSPQTNNESDEGSGVAVELDTDTVSVRERPGFGLVGARSMQALRPFLHRNQGRHW
eukprot:COSAG02_NODE_37693_length_438_cov_4.035398_1_plen_70_part_01